MQRPASSTAPASPAPATGADPRTEFDRLAALLQTPGPLPRETWVALAELAAVPDFDVDLLQPWRAACAAALAPPRSLREEAALLMLLLATGGDEAARSSGCARCLALLKAAPPGKDWALAALALLMNAVWSRDLALAEWLNRQPASQDVPAHLDALRALRWYEALADWHFVEGRTEASLAANTAAAQRAEADGLAERARGFRLAVAMAWLSQKRVPEARAAIAAYSPLPDDAHAVQAVYAAGNLGWLARLEQRWVDSEAHSRHAASLAAYAGMPALEQGVVMLQLARALIALGRCAEALAVIDDAAPKMQGRWVERLRGERQLVLGLQALDEGRRGQAREAVRAGLEIHFAQPHPAPLDQLDGPMARVAAVGLALGAHADALRALVAERRLVAPPEADEHWPWTLRLRLFDGWRTEGLVAAPGEARQKADSKPLQILQMLAAYAPASLPAQRVADALWPEAEGDRAMRSLDVALTRLRPLLPDPALLLRQEGRLQLDPARVWCDTSAALRLVGELTDADRRRPRDAADTVWQDTDQAERALELLALARGPLLPDSREPHARERAMALQAQLAGALQIGLRAAARLVDPARAEDLVRRCVAQGQPADLVRGLLAELAAQGGEAAARSERLRLVFDLARR